MHLFVPITSLSWPKSYDLPTNFAEDPLLLAPENDLIGQILGIKPSKGGRAVRFGDPGIVLALGCSETGKWLHEGGIMPFPCGRTY
jgi:hypothetical protein